MGRYGGAGRARRKARERVARLSHMPKGNVHPGKIKSMLPFRPTEGRKVKISPGTVVTFKHSTSGYSPFGGKGGMDEKQVEKAIRIMHGGVRGQTVRAANRLLQNSGMRFKNEEARA